MIAAESTSEYVVWEIYRIVKIEHNNGREYINHYLPKGQQVLPDAVFQEYILYNDSEPKIHS